MRNYKQIQFRNNIIGAAQVALLIGGCVGLELAAIFARLN